MKTQTYTDEQKAVLFEFFGPGLIYHHNGAVTLADGEEVIKAAHYARQQQTLNAIIAVKKL